MLKVVERPFPNYKALYYLELIDRNRIDIHPNVLRIERKELIALHVW